MIEHREEKEKKSAQNATLRLDGFPFCSVGCMRRAR